MLPETIAGVTVAAFAHHHFAYPVLLRFIARRVRARATAHSFPPAAVVSLPSVTLIVPAHNEAAVIAAKIADIARLDYPREKLTVIIACDGCTDDTVEISQCGAEHYCAVLDIRVHASPVNLGKVAVLNREIAAARSDIIALSDASAMTEPDALLVAARHFAGANVGVVCPTYRLGAGGSEGERAYWAYQTRIKADEAALGAPIGAHGAFYLFRRSLWTPLPADTINDDVVLPMRIVAAGYRAVYDTSIAGNEIETTRPQQEWRRRVRIGAGNLQQAMRLASLAHPSRPGLAFVFLSGKALRSLIPFLALATFIATLLASLQGDPVMSAFLFVQLSLAALAVAVVTLRNAEAPRPLAWFGYLAEGHTASFIGAIRYMAGRESMPWRRADAGNPTVLVTCAEADESYLPRAVLVSKRIVDIVCGLGALLVMLVLFVPIALAIKLTSKGPIFYRQQRVGRVTPTATYLFDLIKFRTMVTDAETKSGAVWATKDDPRITPVGRFMRKTRLDELPQCINVLRGEMSVVGPRPERPGFFNKLEDAIPFYVERTYGLKPGITGLAQVNQAYDTSIEDVRNKVLYDHAYAARLSNWLEWLRTDVGVVFKTVTVMALGKGQ